MRRTAELKAGPAKTREWQQQSRLNRQQRRAAERAAAKHVEAERSRAKHDVPRAEWKPAMRKSKAAAAQGLKRTRGLRARSKKMAKVYRERAPFVAQILEERPWCEARLPGCQGRSVDVHEKLRRSQGGDLLDAEGVLAVCRHCHEVITTNPQAAVDAGLARWRWRANPEDSAQPCGEPIARECAPVVADEVEVEQGWRSSGRVTGTASGASANQPAATPDLAGDAA